MILMLRILRIICGFIAVLQILGLLPALTTWLPNITEVTGGMWAIALIKVVVLALSAVAYYGLGRLRAKLERTDTVASDLPAVGILFTFTLVGGVFLIMRTPVSQDQSAQNAKIGPDTKQERPQSSEQVTQPSIRNETPPHERRAWSGNAFDQFDSVQEIEKKAHSFPSIKDHRAWDAVLSWQDYYMNTGDKSANVALYMGVDHVLEGLKSHGGICRPGKIVIVAQSQASPSFPAGTQLVEDDCDAP